MSYITIEMNSTSLQLYLYAYSLNDLMTNVRPFNIVEPGLFSIYNVGNVANEWRENRDAVLAFDSQQKE